QSGVPLDWTSRSARSQEVGASQHFFIRATAFVSASRGCSARVRIARLRQPLGALERMMFPNSNATYPPIGWGIADPYYSSAMSYANRSDSGGTKTMLEIARKIDPERAKLGQQRILALIKESEHSRTAADNRHY